MGDARTRVVEDFNTDDAARLRFAESLLTLERDRRQVGTRSKTQFDDPADYLNAAQMHVEELNGYRGRKPDEKTKALDTTGIVVEMSVSTRRDQLPKLIDESFQKAIDTADSKDQLKLMGMLTSVDLLIKQRQLEIKQQSERDLFNGYKPPIAAGQNKHDVLDNLTLPELQLLRFRLGSLVSAPSEARLQYAAVLSDRGDLAQSKKILEEAVLKGARGMVFDNLLEDVKTRLRRKELAGGHDPMETARVATSKLFHGDVQGAERLFGAAEAYASGLNHAKLRESLSTVEKELATPNLVAQKREQLKRDKACLEELSHADAAVSFSKVSLAAAQGHFADVKHLLEKAAKVDPEFVAERYDQYLDMMTFAKTNGQESSVSVFHNHLVSFQRYLSPNSFSLERAQSELDKAAAAAQSIPFEDIKKFREVETQKLEKLKTQLRDKTIAGNERTELERRTNEAQAAVDGLKLLQNAPQYVKLMSGVFQLAQRNGKTANEIFAALEKENPEFAKDNAEQLKKLIEMANAPEVLRKEESWVKGLLKELVCTTAAIAAGALVVVATGWSGPAALAAGAGTGALVRTGLKGLMGDEIAWYDPVIGAVDGFSGGAGTLAFKSAYNGFSASARTLSATERALVATGADAAALEGLSGSARVLTAQRLAAQGAAEIGAQLPWTTRMATRFLPYAGNPAYREALNAAGRLANANLWNRTAASAFGATTTSAISRAAHNGLDALDGRYAGIGDFTSQYFLDVTNDAMFGAVGGRLLPLKGFSPVLYPGHRLAVEIPNQLPRLAEIEKVLALLDAPPNPRQIREWYLTMPGPKVNPNEFKRPVK